MDKTREREGENEIKINKNSLTNYLYYVVSTVHSSILNIIYPIYWWMMVNGVKRKMPRAILVQPLQDRPHRDFL